MMIRRKENAMSNDKTVSRRIAFFLIIIEN